MISSTGIRGNNQGCRGHGRVVEVVGLVRVPSKGTGLDEFWLYPFCPFFPHVYTVVSRGRGVRVVGSVWGSWGVWGIRGSRLIQGIGVMRGKRTIMVIRFIIDIRLA